MPDLDSPAMPTNTNTVDMSDAEAIKKTTEDQAKMRLKLVKMMIAWHRRLVSLDRYCEQLAVYIEASHEYHRNKGYQRAPGVIEGLEKNWRDTYAAWEQARAAKDLAASLKTMPKEVKVDALLTFGHGLQHVYWTLFREIFDVFFCGPTQMVAVYFPDAQTRRDFNAAIDYAEAKGKIVVPASMGSFQSA